MKHNEPVKVLYLPSWFVESVGISTVESLQSLTPVLDRICKDGPGSEDFLKVQAANYALSVWVYGPNQPTAQVATDLSIINFMLLGPVDVSNDHTHNLLESMYGIHSPASDVEDRKERFQIVCRGFEDIVFKTFGDGSVLIYNNPHAPEYYRRERLLKTLVCHLIGTVGYKGAIKTELFKTYLSSSYKEEDLKHGLYHRVG